ncbi:Histone chaperone ASF1A, partial [Schistosoma japonicum]
CDFTSDIPSISYCQINRSSFSHYCFLETVLDLEWKLVYVSSAYNPSLDQTLDSVLVGPIPVGRHQFFFEANAPDPKIIPNEDIVGVTVVLIQALYRDKEFIRVGYYVNNEYKKEELRLEPPAEPILDELERHIIASDPRVTRFPIDWGDGLLDGCPEPEQPVEDIEESNLLYNNEQVENISRMNQENENRNDKLDSSNFCESQSCMQFTESTSCIPLHPVQSSTISVDSF